MIYRQITNLIQKAMKEFQEEGAFPEFVLPEIKIEHPEEKIHGDYAANVAMLIAKQVKKSPQEIANILNSKFKIQNSKFLDKVEVVKPGFINFFISKEYLQEQVAEILKKKEKFGALKIGKEQKINLEFISANPTGPLTLGNGRGGFCGDVLANVLLKAGFKVAREYYINDVGEQIRKLGHSVIGDSEAVYKGDYILSLRKRIKGENPDKLGQKAAEIILKETIKPTVKKMGIAFDVWFSEKSLRKSGEVKKILDLLKKKKLTYEKEGALWFSSTKFGDDKDRVLIKEDGETTYLASDIAYLKNKFKRGFNYLIYIWGADHYGYINRLKAAAEALGEQKERVNIIIMQLVRLFRGGKEVRMSKRAGTYVTLNELIDEVGLDVARFFFLTRSPGSHLNFDLDLAKEQSEKNPVYYIQYAYARICSILRKCGKSEIQSTKSKINPKIIVSKTKVFEKLEIQNSKLNLLNHPSELNLIKQLIRFPEVIEDTAKDEQVQRLPQYAGDLAAAFHQFYRDCRVLTETQSLSMARLGLILATKQVIKNTLDLLGISAPEKM
ncbi:arginine--tRNA ligase [Patescibacteria group bacterium]|nr:arginine--tRNA ligase [Patescibacteria group bacterium]MBU4480980.1 arginine--tRNA ligase [Patescibacteria group bacterium]